MSSWFENQYQAKFIRRLYPTEIKMNLVIGDLRLKMYRLQQEAIHAERESEKVYNELWARIKKSNKTKGFKSLKIIHNEVYGLKRGGKKCL
jgi:rubrerythrin